MARNISASRRRAEWQQHLDVAAIPCLPKRRQERRSFCAAARLFIGGSRRIDRDRGVLQGGSYPRGFRGPPRRTGAASPMQRRQRRRRPSDDAAVHSGRWRPSSCFFGTAVQVVSEYRVLSVSLSARARAKSKAGFGRVPRLHPSGHPGPRGPRSDPPMTSCPPLPPSVRWGDAHTPSSPPPSAVSGSGPGSRSQSLHLQSSFCVTIILLGISCVTGCGQT